MSKTKRKHRPVAQKPAGVLQGPAAEPIPAPASAPCMTEEEAEVLASPPCAAEAPASPPEVVGVEQSTALACVAEAESLIAALPQAPAEPAAARPADDGTKDAAPGGAEEAATQSVAKPDPAADWLFPPAANVAGSRPSPFEAERDMLLRVIPDQIFRIRLKPDGGVLVLDGRTRPGAGDHEALDRAVEPDEHVIDPPDSLRSALARRSRETLDSFRQSGEVQAFEIEAGQDGQARHYEIRAAGCPGGDKLAVVHNGQTTFLEIGAPADAAGELLVLARDITSRREAEASIARSQDEVTRLNEVLKSEASSHAEDEEIMENAFRKLGRLLENTIGALQMIVQMKDPPTAQHQARVCKLACAIGREMGLDKSQVDTIGLAALLHDLGKILIPSDMLNKPGRLTDKELTAIRNSAETEYQILKTIDLFCPIADIVHQHHERLDGSGYPLGLKGDDILLEARVIAVADVVEAMVSERPYRPALSLGAALKEIQVNKGKLYDVGAVEACSRVFMGGTFQLDGADDSSLLEGAYSGA